MTLLLNHVPHIIAGDGFQCQCLSDSSASALVTPVPVLCFYNNIIIVCAYTDGSVA